MQSYSMCVFRSLIKMGVIMDRLILGQKRKDTSTVGGRFRDKQSAEDPSDTGNVRQGRKVIKAWKTGSLDRKSGMNKGKDRMERGFRTGMRNDQDGTGKRLVARNLCMTGGETF